MRLLSVDWDFFFPVPEIDKEFLYDWGHSENPSIPNSILWNIRGVDFIQRNKPLPLTSGEELNFWERFCFVPDVALYYADSHFNIYSAKVRKNITEIWNFDAHHDSYQTEKQMLDKGLITCENWATLFSSIGIKVNTVYPQWKKWAIKEDKPKGTIEKRRVDNKNKFQEHFDRIFVCRSGAWTPPWIDKYFWDFITKCPVKNKIKIDKISPIVFDNNEIIKIITLLKKNE